jgi:hypothetical protein
VQKPSNLYSFIYKTSRIAIFIGILFYFYYAFNSGRLTFDGVLAVKPLSLTIAFLLIFVNYGLESYKWFLLNTEEKTMLKCVKSVLSGCGISLLVPFKWMNFLGWAYNSEPKEWRKLMWSTFPSAFAQNIITLAFTVAFLPWLFLSQTAISLVGLYYLFGVFIVVFSVVFYFKFFKSPFNIQLFSGQLSLKSLGFENSVLKRVLMASFLRYTTFILQYVLLFNAFDVSMGISTVLVGSALTMGLTSFFPVSFLGKLGIRETIGISVFSAFSGSIEPQVLAVTISVWIFNVLVPAVIGGGIIVSQKRRLHAN